MEDKKYIVYNHKSRSDIISENVIATLNEVYNISYPKPEKSFTEMCNDIKLEAKKANREYDENFRLEYCDGKYQWPIDFFYIPQKVLEEVWHNRQDAYGIRQYWKENMEVLIDFMFINGGGLKDVYSPTDWSNGESVRHCEKMPLLKDIIGSDNADKVKDVLESFMNTYKWGLMDVNHFAWGFMSTPTCNRETVVNAWKDAFGIDVVIPDDSFWIDEYTKEEIDETDSYNNE